MIKINLALKKQSTSVAGDSRSAAPGGGGMLAGMRDVKFDGLKDLPIRKLALMVIVGFGATYLLDDFKATEIKIVEDQLVKARDEQSKLTAELTRTKGYEDIKKTLDADELMLRTKIDTIQKLLADRQNPPKMMMTLATTIPQDVWLKGLKIKDREVSLQGASIGFNSISDFMKGLNESAYFSDVQLKGTQQERDELGSDIAGFELVAKRR
ncbi:PilN domain-containing protein [Bdellovibrionota bacterium FG-1]